MVQWLMVCVDMENATLEQMPEMLDCEVHGQKLPAEGAIAGLRRLQLAGEERERRPSAADSLLKHGTDSAIGGVDHEADIGMRLILA